MATSTDGAGLLHIRTPRQRSFARTITFKAVDLSALTWVAEIRAVLISGPDLPALVQEITVSDSYVGADTVVELSVSAADIQDLPASARPNDDLQLWWSLVAGDGRVLYGRFIVEGDATE